MIPVDPTNLDRGDAVFVRYTANAGSGQEPTYRFREARVHESKPRVVFIKFKDDNYKQLQKVRPCQVFLDSEMERVSTVSVTLTLRDTLEDTDFSDVRETTGEDITPVESNDLFGENMPRKTTKSKPAEVITAPLTFSSGDFKAWLEMGKTFTRIPERLLQLRNEAKEVEAQLSELEARQSAIEEEELRLSAQHEEMLRVMGVTK